MTINAYDGFRRPLARANARTATPNGRIHELQKPTGRVNIACQSPMADRSGLTVSPKKRHKPTPYGLATVARHAVAVHAAAARPSRSRGQRGAIFPTLHP